MRLPNGYGGIVKLNGNRRNPYRVRITKGWKLTENNNVKQIYETLGYYPTRKAAMIALAEYNKDPYELATRKVTFDECYNTWAVKHHEKYVVSGKILTAIYKYCAPIKHMAMVNIKLKHLQDVMDSVKDKSISLQSNLKTIFLKTYRYALENDIVQKNYASFVTINPTPPKKDINSKFFTKDEIKAVFDNIDWTSVMIQKKDKARANVKLVDSIITMLYTGVRIGELLNIKLSDIDIEARIIHIAGTKTKAANRIVPIHKELVPYLQNRMNTSKKYLFEIFDDKITLFRYYHKFFYPFAKHIGITHTPHTLRHTFISIMDTNGVSAESVVLKRIVGHANKTITEHYTHKDIDALIEAIDKFKLPT